MIKVSISLNGKGKKEFVFQTIGDFVDFLIEEMLENPKWGFASVCSLPDAKKRKFHALALSNHSEIEAIKWGFRRVKGKSLVTIVARGKQAIVKLIEQQGYV